MSLRFSTSKWEPNYCICSNKSRLLVALFEHKHAQKAHFLSKNARKCAKLSNPSESRHRFQNLLQWRPMGVYLVEGDDTPITGRSATPARRPSPTEGGRA